MKVALPLLWVFMLLNYLYCDVLSLTDPANLKDVLAGHAAGGSVQITPEFLLASAVLMEIPMVMILLSRVLGHRAARSANVVAAAFMTRRPVGAGTLTANAMSMGMACTNSPPIPCGMSANSHLSSMCWTIIATTRSPLTWRMTTAFCFRW